MQYTNATRANTTANPVLMAPLVALSLGATLAYVLFVAGPALAYRGAALADKAAARHLRRRRAAYRAAARAAVLPRMAGTHATAHLSAARPVVAAGAPLGNAARLLRWTPGTPAAGFATPAPAVCPGCATNPAPVCTGCGAWRDDHLAPAPRYPAPAPVPFAVLVEAPAPAPVVPAPAPQDTPAQQQDTPAAPPAPYGWDSVATPPPGTAAEEAARTGRPLWVVSRDRRRAARKLALAAAREQEPNADGPVPAPAVDQTDRYHTSMTYRQLQQECKARGLSAGGNRGALLLRLQAADRAA